MTHTLNQKPGDTVINTNPEIIRFFIVRHGQTNENKAKILQGHLNTQLSDLGVKQAKLCGNRFQNIKIDKIFCSDLSRCLQTLHRILEEHNDCILYDTKDFEEHLHKAAVLHKSSWKVEPKKLTSHSAGGDLFKKEVIITPSFRERCFGPVEGMNIIEAEEYARKANPNLTPRDFGETKEEFRKRYLDELNSQLSLLSKDSNTKNCMLVTHGGLIKSLIKSLMNDYNFDLNTHIKKEEVRVVFNTSVTVIDFYKKDITNGVNKGKIQLIGDTAHLGNQLEVDDQRVL